MTCSKILKFIVEKQKAHFLYMKTSIMPNSADFCFFNAQHLNLKVALWSLCICSIPTGTDMVVNLPLAGRCSETKVKIGQWYIYTIKKIWLFEIHLYSALLLSHLNFGIICRTCYELLSVSFLILLSQICFNNGWEDWPCPTRHLFVLDHQL